MPALSFEEHFADEEARLRVRAWRGGKVLAEDWGRFLRRDQQIYCLNQGAPLFIMGGRSRLHLLPGMLGTFRSGETLRALSSAGHEGAQRFLTLEINPAWIKKKFAAGLSQIPPVMASQLEDGPIEVALPARLMSASEQELLRQLGDPPMEGLPRAFWYQAKILEFLSLQLFRDPTQTPFCTTHKRRTTEHVAGVLARLRQRLDEPLDLTGLAASISVAPSSLSRMVSAETGRSLSQHLRSLRIERAVELMRRGRHNVTEAAIEVGYNSLSHFTKAFITEKGQRPSEFLKSLRL
ncbi:MAG: helix-turn-helix domain-containing protein [Verrucomicrobiales bacterium]